GTDMRGPADGCLLGIDEQADTNALELQAPHDRDEPFRRRIGRPTRLTRDFAWHDRHERALVRLDLEHEVHQVGPGIAFDVVLDAIAERRETRRDVAHVSGCDVPLVGSGVHRDARRPRRAADIDGLERARYGSAARVAKGRGLVDVDAETDAPGAGHFVLTVAAIVSAHARISCSLRPSIMMRSSGSVPE